MSTSKSPAHLAFLVATVSLAGLAIVAGAILDWHDEDATFLGALVALAVASEIFDFAPFPNSRISMSIALILAAGTLSGLPGVAVVASATVIADYAVHRKRFAKVAFNEGTLLLTGAAYVGTLDLFSARDIGDWPAILGPALLGSFIAFVINSGLVTVAVALDTGQDASSVWNTRFRWLLPHYLLLGVVALVVALAYDRWEMGGLALLLGPMAVVWLAMKHYAAHAARAAHTTSHP